ncbi:MAG: hypothetical protein GY829_02450 [Gammaproteobacteria bacterium]|nr:hypothetical protein [Gammaproteobacteria bacterium]
MNEQLSPSDKIKQKSARRSLIILACVFAIPYAVAYFLFFSNDAASSLGTSNKGQLVSPMRAMKAMSFNNVNDNSEVTLDFTGGWTMLTLASSSCDIECTDNLYAIKQVRSAVGVDRRDVKRIMLLTDQDYITELKTKVDDFYGMDILTTSNKNQTEFQQFLQIDDQPLENAIFLFDTKGNYMMYYGPSTHPKLILKDMLLLLKVSKH